MNPIIGDRVYVFPNVSLDANSVQTVNNSDAVDTTTGSYGTITNIQGNMYTIEFDDNDGAVTVYKSAFMKATNA